MSITPISAKQKQAKTAEEKTAGGLLERLQGQPGQPGTPNLGEQLKGVFGKFRTLIFRPQGSNQVIEAEKKGDKVDLKMFADQNQPTPASVQNYSLQQFVDFIMKKFPADQQQNLVKDLEQDGMAAVPKQSFAHLARYVRLAAVVQKSRMKKASEAPRGPDQLDETKKPPFDEKQFMLDEDGGDIKSGSKAQAKKNLVRAINEYTAAMATPDELDEEPKPKFDEKQFMLDDDGGDIKTGKKATRDPVAALEEYVTAVKTAHCCPVDSSKNLGLQRIASSIAVYCRVCGGVGTRADSARAAVANWNQYGPVAKKDDKKKKEDLDGEKKYPEGQI